MTTRIFTRFLCYYTIKCIHLYGLYLFKSQSYYFFSKWKRKIIISRVI